MVLNPSYFGTLGHHNTMIHEMGHILGLYHVFKGVSERDSCDDPCQVSVSLLTWTYCMWSVFLKLWSWFQETTPSMETGDLCADTAPTPKSKACHDPGAVNDTCGVTTYQDTPYNNYMSYTGKFAIWVIYESAQPVWLYERLWVWSPGQSQHFCGRFACSPLACVCFFQVHLTVHRHTTLGGFVTYKLRGEVSVRWLHVSF